MIKFIDNILNIKKLSPTQYKINSGFLGNLGIVAHIQLRQIFDLTIFQRIKIWLLDFNEQKPLVIRYCYYISRWQALREGVNKEQE